MKTEYYKSRTISVLVVAMFILCSVFVAVPGMVDGSDADPGTDNAVSDATSLGSDDPTGLLDENRLGDLLRYLVTVNDEGISPLAEVIYSIIHNESFDNMLKDILIENGLSPMAANNVITIMKGIPINNIQTFVDDLASLDYDALFVILKDVSTGTVSFDDFKKRLEGIGVPSGIISLITEKSYKVLINVLDLSTDRIYDSLRKAIEIDESKYSNVISKDLTLSDRTVLSNVLVKDGVTITFNSGSSLKVNGKLCFEGNVKLIGAPVDITVTSKDGK
ncbi:MAG: hypothetical protein MJZ68_04800, partial [archaeon]|nr:hypothetical protein [archaeon]